MTFNLRPIGTLQTPYVDKFGTPRQGALAPSSSGIITLNPELQPELITEGLKSFSHIWLITWFHKQDTAKIPIKIEPPRLKGERLGTLATRSPHRPNPIGLTLVKLINIHRGQIHVSGVDLVDGTPVLDIKPYIQEVDEALQSSKGWLEQTPWPKLSVQFAATFESSLKLVQKIEPLPVSEEHLKSMIQESLSLDPRPSRDHDKSPPERPFWLRLYDLDIRFHYVAGHITVSFIRFAQGAPQLELFRSYLPEDPPFTVSD